MATKDDYYQRILAALQSDIASQKSETQEFKRLIEIQQNAIQDCSDLLTLHKATTNDILTDDVNAKLLQPLKIEMENLIEENFDIFSKKYTNNSEFFLLYDFAHNLPVRFGESLEILKNSFEERIKPIEEKLQHRISLFKYLKRPNKTCSGPDHHPPTHPSFWQTYKKEIAYFVTTLVISTALFIANLINENHHLRKESQLMHTIQKQSSTECDSRIRKSR